MSNSESLPAFGRPRPTWQRPPIPGQESSRPGARALPPPAAKPLPGAQDSPARGAAPATTPAAAAAAEEKDLTWPFIIVLIYFIVDFGRPQTWVPPLGALKPGMFALGGGLLTLLARKELLYFPTRAKLMAAFLVLMAMGTPFATNRYWAFMATKDFAFFIFGAVVPLMSFVNTYSRMTFLIGFVIMIHIPLAVYGIVNSGFGIGSFLGDENDFCLALNVIIPYVLFSFYYVKKPIYKLVLLGTLGLFLFAVTATQSRGGFLGLVAVALYAWLASPRKFASLGVMVLVALPVLALVPQSYWDEIRTIETSTENDDTGAQRLYLWSMGWEMFKDNPIVGVGPTNYQWNSFKYEDPNEKAKGLHVWGKGAHSLYFTLLPEQGLVGAGLFVGIVIIGFYESRKVRKMYKQHLNEKTLDEEHLQHLYIINVVTRANDAAIVAYLVTGAFLSVLYYPHLWLQAGIGVALKRTADMIVAHARPQVPPQQAPTRFAVPSRT